MTHPSQLAARLVTHKQNPEEAGLSEHEKNELYVWADELQYLLERPNV